MIYRSGALCLVVRDGRILMVKHCRGATEYYTLPGGGIEKGESPQQAAVRELWEECHVKGKIIKKVSEYPFALDDAVILHTFYMDIGDQSPLLGPDLSEEEKQVLVEVRCMSLAEICERDRAFLWASGLASIPQFYSELVSWNNDLSYPGKYPESSKK
ncbi:MAG: NUDIX hydrolase [Christensenellales bacterium]|jgi:8-oxo-dGTP diphosphatase